MRCAVFTPSGRCRHQAEHFGECEPEVDSSEEPRPEGRKDDAGKPRWDLLPWGATAVVVDVLTDGAQVYAPRNWEQVESPRDRYFAAAQRHLSAWWRGQSADPKSGKPHLAHAACCVLFLLALELGETR